MSADVEAELTRLRQQAEAARASYARAEAVRAAAQQTLDQAVAELRDEFGVSTPAEAAELVNTLEQQLAAEMQRVRDQLSAVGETQT